MSKIVSIVYIQRGQNPALFEITLCLCRTQRDMLIRLKMFNISCILTASQLECNVDDGFAPVVPGTSYCQINNQPEPFECEKII